MKDAYVLNYLMLVIAQFVQITIDLRQADIFIKMILQILHCRSFACRIRQTGFYKLAEYLIIYPVESHAVKDTVKYQVRSIDRDVGYARKHLFGTQKFCITLLTFLTEKIQPWMAVFLFPIYPFTTFHYERIYLFLSARYTYSGKLIHLALDLFNHYDTYIA